MSSEAVEEFTTFCSSQHYGCDNMETEKNRRSFGTGLEPETLLKQPELLPLATLAPIIAT